MGEIYGGDIGGNASAYPNTTGLALALTLAPHPKPKPKPTP